MELPTGTVTFLFTDIEGSTKLLQCRTLSSRSLIRAKLPPGFWMRPPWSGPWQRERP
jgi:hypothetical protein